MDEEEDDGNSAISLESGDSRSEGTLEEEEEAEVEDDENSVAGYDSNNEDEDEDPAHQEFYENFFRRVNISNNTLLFNKCKNCSVF